jgi:hypothetical protein
LQSKKGQKKEKKGQKNKSKYAFGVLKKGGQKNVALPHHLFILSIFSVRLGL